MNIIKITLLLFLSLNITSLLAQINDLEKAQEVQVLAKISAMKQGSLTLQSGQQSIKQSIRFASAQVEKVIKNLLPHEEVLLSGQIVFEKIGKMDSFQIWPVFIIQRAQPISLKLLGKHEGSEIIEQNITFSLERKPYGPRKISVNPELAGAITITASILLLKAFASKGIDQNVSNKLNDHLLFSSGALATGLFIFEQLGVSRD